MSLETEDIVIDDVNNNDDIDFEIIDNDDDLIYVKYIPLPPEVPVQPPIHTRELLR